MDQNIETTNHISITSSYTRKYYYRIKSLLFVMILFIPFFKPFSINFLEPIRRAYSLSVPPVFFISAFLYIFMTKKNMHTLILIVFQLLYVLSTMINGMPLNIVIMSSVSLITVSFLVEYMIQNDARLLLRGLVYLSVLLVLINFALLIVFPEGVLIGERGERINFWHIDNELPPFIIPAMALAMIYSLYTKNKITKCTIVFLIICVITLLIAWSGTGIAALIVICLHYLIVHQKKIQKIITMRSYVSLFIVTFLGIVIFEIQHYFSFFIESILRKDITFTNRVFIWNKALDVIKDSSPLNLIMGYGERSLLRELTGISYYGHAHSEIFEIILKTGFVGLVLFLILVFLSAKKLTKHQNNKMASLLMGFLFSFYIMSIVETCFSISFYIMLILSLNIDRIIRQSEDYRESKIKTRKAQLFKGNRVMHLETKKKV